MLLKNLVLNYVSNILSLFLGELGKDDMNFTLMSNFPTSGDTVDCGEN